jgi:hypothetical protein
MLQEQSPKLASTYAKPSRQCFYAIVIAVERAFADKTEGVGNRVRSSAP